MAESPSRPRSSPPRDFSELRAVARGRALFPSVALLGAPSLGQVWMRGSAIPSRRVWSPLCVAAVFVAWLARLVDRGRQRATCLTGVFGYDLVALLVVFRSPIYRTPAAVGVAMAEVESDRAGAVKPERRLADAGRTTERERR